MQSLLACGDTSDLFSVFSQKLEGLEFLKDIKFVHLVVF